MELEKLFLPFYPQILPLRQLSRFPLIIFNAEIINPSQMIFWYYFPNLYKFQVNRPVLLFPEGSCTNNTRVLRFRKAVFEDSIVIYPIAIR